MDSSKEKDPILKISSDLLEQIQQNGERCYPDEGAGLLLGRQEDNRRVVVEFLPLENIREAPARRKRYALSPMDYVRAEREAERSGLEVIGIFHSHPDHPDNPSEYDREWAMPWFSYLITSVNQGRATSSRSWQLSEDRAVFKKEALEIIPKG
jgi:proteasome lid subunit RPN8/RPN11